MSKIRTEAAENLEKRRIEAENLRRQLYASAGAAGLNIAGISDDKCCQLLAWLYVFGGGCEDSVFNTRFNAALTYAQARLNVLSGEKVNRELAPVLQEYIKSIVDYKNPPEWVVELETEYRVKVYRERWD